MNEKILVVDDERELADLLEVYLKNDSYTVYKYYNGRDALEGIEENTPDLAILDVMLPDMDDFRICNGIFNHTSLCEFYQGKLLLHLTMPFEEKPKTNLPCDNLKYYRQRKQMTTRQLAEKLDIAPVTVVMYENGKHPIPYDVAIKLADVLKIEAALFYDDFSRFLAVPYTEALKSVRMALGLSQKAFAEQIEVIPSYYYKLEEGNRRPSRKVYQKICAALEATGRQTSLLWEQPLQ